jgi:hypothetical protein
VEDEVVVVSHQCVRSWYKLVAREDDGSEAKELMAIVVGDEEEALIARVHGDVQGRVVEFPRRTHLVTNLEVSATLSA